MRTATLLQTELDGEPCTDRVLALLDRWDHDDHRPFIKSLTPAGEVRTNAKPKARR